MPRFKPIQVTYGDLNLSNKQIETFQTLSSEISIIQNSIPFIKEFVARGGFLLDTIIGIEPHDIDFFYSLHSWKTKDWQGCSCDDIKVQILSLYVPLINSRKTDLGHILEGEIYFDPIEKVIGPFSHHDINSRICLDKNGVIWTCKESLDGINTKTYEWSYDAAIQFAYYPYFPNDTYVTFYTRNVIRGLRMIYTKKYLRVGPVYKGFLEQSHILFDQILKDQDKTQNLRNYILEKTDNMHLEEFKEALEITKVSNRQKVLYKIEKILQT